ncbi:MAG: hypothetical protein AAF638_07995 [Pseudomonadota bacterium]
MTDAAQLWSLISRSEAPVLITVMLFSGLWVTFGSVAAGAAIMMLNQDDEEPRRPSGGHRSMTPQPIPVRAAPVSVWNRPKDQ